ncbi:MAG: hypothetical protein AAFQ91_24200 [Cyanobacteria bacterium J06621_15]
MDKNTKKNEKKTKTSKYQELNDSELEVVCGGSNKESSAKSMADSSSDIKNA